jgi:two-component system, LytTR family, sensor kinase
MKHPATGIGLAIYALVWGMVACLHFVFLYVFFGIEWTTAWTDALLFSFGLGLFGYSVWFVVRSLAAPSAFSWADAASRLGAAVMMAAAAAFLARSVWTWPSIHSMAGPDPWLGYQPVRFGIALLWSCLLVTLYTLRQSAHQIKTYQDSSLELKSLVQESELEMLKFQINPHFIFNSLNSISALTLSNAEAAREMVIKLSEFLRATLRPERNSLQSLEEELRHMELYLEIERIRFGERLKVEMQVDRSCLDVEMPVMILQPLYENAVKYGVYGQLSEVRVVTTVRCEEEEVVIGIANTYEEGASMPKGKGIGLENVRKRLKLIYGEGEYLEIDDRNHTFQVRVRIPLKSRLSK